MREEFRRLQEFDRQQYQNVEKVYGLGEDRYSDVLPYSATAVRLKSSKFTQSGYINGNYIRVGKEECIATQGPLSNTVFTFWQMVWEKLGMVDCVNVIMVTELSECGREKCFDYVSRMKVDVEKVFKEFGCVDVCFNEMYTICDGKVEIREIVVDGGKIVRHIWIRGWPDFGVPEEEDCNLSVVKWLGEDKFDKKYNIVHCSAGVGRSGTFIALDYIIRHGLKEDKIFEIVLNMRKCRVMMVQRFNQYEYLYRAVK